MNNRLKFRRISIPHRTNVKSERKNNGGVDKEWEEGMPKLGETEFPYMEGKENSCFCFNNST